MAAGFAHSAAINESGQLFSWGKHVSAFAPGGCSSSKARPFWTCQKIPVLVPLPVRIEEGVDGSRRKPGAKWIDVACGREHTVAVAEDGGSLHAWRGGDGKDGVMVRVFTWGAPGFAVGDAVSGFGHGERGGRERGGSGGSARGALPLAKRARVGDLGDSGRCLNVCDGFRRVAVCTGG